MYLVWPKTDPWNALQDAIFPGLKPALTACGLVAPLTVAPGSAGGPLLALAADGLLLSPELLGTAQYTAADQRWLDQLPQSLAPLVPERLQRCTGLILEGILLHRLAQRLEIPPESLPIQWWTVGAVAEEVDRRCPELGWLWLSAAGLLQQPGLSMPAQPRRWAWFLRWRQAQGQPLALSTPEAPTIDPLEWARFGQWCRDAEHGPAASAPLTITPAHSRADPTMPLRPLSHHPLHWSAGPAGLRVQGATLAPPVRLGGGEEIETVLGTIDGGISVLDARPARVVGRWMMRSGQAGQRLGVAKGIELHFHPDGRLEITLSNAWMGPADAENHAIARQLGASGIGRGRWQVLSLEAADGAGVLRLSALDINQIRLHPRRTRMRRFALPAGDGQRDRVRRLLGQLTERPIRFTLDSSGLLLSGELRNHSFQIRLTPA